MRRVIPFAPWQTAYFLRWLRDMSDRGWVLQTIKGVKAVFVPAAPIAALLYSFLSLLRT